MDDTTLPIPEGESALVPDPALDEFKADELAPHEMDADLAPSPPKGDIMPDVDTQSNLDPKEETPDAAA
jgi:hypothetical protein